MLPLHSETRHTRFHIGHSFMAVGIFMGLLLSILLSAIPSQNALAFGTNDIAVLSNQERTNNSVATLTISAKLSAAAQAKADHMIANNYFEHTAPDGTTGWYFISQQGYAYSSAGENLAASNEGATAIVQGWMNSPGHRANLLNTTYKEVGYGISYRGQFQGYDNVYFVVALYAKPVSQSSIAAPDGSAPAGGSTPPSAVSPGSSGGGASPSGSSSNESTISLKVNSNPQAIESFSGTSTQLSKPRLRLSSETALAIASVSGVLVIIGIAIDLTRLWKHGVGIHTFHHR